MAWPGRGWLKSKTWPRGSPLALVLISIVSAIHSWPCTCKSHCTWSAHHKEGNIQMGCTHVCHSPLCWRKSSTQSRMEINRRSEINANKQWNPFITKFHGCHFNFQWITLCLREVPVAVAFSQLHCACVFPVYAGTASVLPFSIQRRGRSRTQMWISLRSSASSVSSCCRKTAANCEKPILLKKQLWTLSRRLHA